MVKKISCLTSHDKKLFLEATKQAMKREHHVELADIERKIQDEIDLTFDDARYKI